MLDLWLKASVRKWWWVLAESRLRLLYPVSDNMFHYASHTVTLYVLALQRKCQHEQFLSRFPLFCMLTTFFFAKFLALNLFFSFSYSSLDSPSEFASDSLTFAIVKLHTKWRDPVIDDAVLSLCQVCDIICVTDVWLPRVYVVWAARRQCQMSFCISGSGKMLLHKRRRYKNWCVLSLFT